jgi:hypothetical protein
MIEAWEWCITHQNNDPANPIMVVSTSFGGGRYTSTCDGASPAMTTAAANAVAAGMTLFVSSGNGGYCDSIGWPACISHVISVGAVWDAALGGFYTCVDAASCASKTTSPCSETGFWAPDNSAADKVTTYSNTAPFLTLFAPSHMAYTTDIVGAGGYSAGDYDDNFGGTSASCPYAAGAGAVLQSKAKALRGSFLTPAEVKSLLVNHGDLVTDGKVAITKPRVNLGRAAGEIALVPWNHPVSDTSVWTNQDFETTYNTYDTFIADDFTIAQRWSITNIMVPGDLWNNTATTLNCASTLNFYIYRNNGGVPDGYPNAGLGAGGNPPLWSLSISPSDARISISTGSSGLGSNVTVTLATPLFLDPDTYWLIFYPTLSLNSCGQYGRQLSNTNTGYPAKVINPGGAFGLPAVWSDAGTAWGFSEQDFAFTILGSTPDLSGPYLLLLLD